MKYFIILILSALPMASSATGKSFPVVTFDQVERIFGTNLDSSDDILSGLLLAIAMDHTTTESPFINERIGIPYIVHLGPDYYVARLISGDESLEVLVNNALVLLFGNKEIPNANALAESLMKKAAKLGYWPADYFLAETRFKHYMAASDDGDTIAHRAVIRDAIVRYERCSKVGFAPCMLRLGHMLTSTPEQLTHGIDLLRTGIRIANQDTRYSGMLNGIQRAIQEVLLKGDLAGVKQSDLEAYAVLSARLGDNTSARTLIK